MATIPASLLFGFFPVLLDNGTPAVGYKLHFLRGGTSLDKDTYPDANRVGTNLNPVTLDAAGLATVFIDPGAYDVEILTPALALVRTVEGVQDIGQTFATDMGITLGTGSDAVTSGYTIGATDQAVTVASTGGPNPCVINLPAVLGRGLPVLVKNIGTVPIALTAFGADTIDSVNPFTIPAASTPAFPSVLLFPDGVSNWLIAASHKVP